MVWRYVRVRTVFKAAGHPETQLESSCVDNKNGWQILYSAIWLTGPSQTEEFHNVRSTGHVTLLYFNKNYFVIVTTLEDSTLEFPYKKDVFLAKIVIFFFFCFFLLIKFKTKTDIFFFLLLFPPRVKIR